MEKYDQYGYLRYELFEELIPRMLYHGTEEEQEEFFQLLCRDGGKLVYSMFQALCEDDGLSCPYCQEDFATQTLKRGGFHILQMLMPLEDPGAFGVLRAYLVYMPQDDGTVVRRCFVVKRFQNGNIFNVVIPPESEAFLGEELTGHDGDMEYEYWRLVADFTKFLIRLM